VASAPLDTSEAPPQAAQRNHAGSASLAQYFFAPLCGAAIFYGQAKEPALIVTPLAIEDV
jgi:hypothetical protein